ncbi:MAG: PAS domain S-box protein [Acidobacteriota bacterium]|nr:PAS domain S-box protein [Acidobacteriota bacterium]
MKLRFASMTVGLTLGVTAAVVVACGVAAYFYSVHHFKSILNMARANALAEGELIHTALDHAMLRNDQPLIAQMIEGFGKQARVEQLVLLNRNGVPRYSSTPLNNGEDFRLSSPTCQACHRDPPERRVSSRVIETRGGSVLRTVIPIRNHEECYACHDAAQKINGVLILDYDAGEVRAGMTRDLRWMVAGAGTLTFVIVGAIFVVIRISVLRRLRRLEATARLVSQGDLKRRAPVEGSDTLAWLGREFNIMADSVAGLVGEVSAQRERLETVINSIDDGIVVLDPERKIIAANDAFLRRTGSSRNQVLDHYCYQLGMGSCNLPDCPTLEYLKSGTHQVRICEHRNGNGAVAWEEIHVSPILDANGRLTHVVEVWRDISERRAAEANLAESHRLASLGVLASGFSHELNTPLGTVLTCIEGILRATPAHQEGQLESARIRENASIAREQLLRCRGITQQFLRLSRGQRHDGGIVDLREAIEAAQRLVGPTARAHSVQIVVRPLAASVHVRAGEAELQDLLINLLLNAIQASKPGSKVVVEARCGSDVRVRVSDEGCGIAPECLQKIFEPFFSLREGGTGLGLFLSLNAVRNWGGDILVESVPGKGSMFEVVLPAIHACPEPEVQP